MKTMKNEKGFSAIELMMVVAISTAIAYSMFTAMRVGQDHAETVDLRMTVQDSAREGLYKMVQEIRESAPTRVTMSLDCSTITFNVPDPNNPIVAGSYAVNWPGHQITYSVNANGQITRSNDTTAQTTIIANDVTSTMFTTDTTSPFVCTTLEEPTSITVVLNAQRALRNGVNVPATPLQMAGQARLRNT